MSTGNGMNDERNALERLERWTNGKPGWRNGTRLGLADEGGYEVRLVDHDADRRILGEGPTLAAAIHAALDQAGAE